MRHSIIYYYISLYIISDVSKVHDVSRGGFLGWCSTWTFCAHRIPGLYVRLRCAYVPFEVRLKANLLGSAWVGGKMSTL